jgi:hypothetical protein
MGFLGEALFLSVVLVALADWGLFRLTKGLPKWWLLWPFVFWPAAIFVRHTRALRKQHPQSPPYFPFFLLGFFASTDLLLFLLARCFPSVTPTSIHQSFIFSVIGMAIYSNQLAQFIWLDFKTSATVTAGYVSLVVLSGSVWWWFYIVVQWAVLIKFANAESPVRRITFAALLACIYWVLAARRPAKLHDQKRAVKLRMFLPRLVFAYMLLVSTFSILYRVASWEEGFCTTPCASATPTQTRPLQIEDAFYLSVITQTTTGYGDITACLPRTRAFASLQALSGTMLLLLGFGYLLTSLEGADGSESSQRSVSQNL